MSDEQISAPLVVESAEPVVAAESAKPTRRKAPARPSRKKPPADPVEALAVDVSLAAPDEAPPKPKVKRAPRKPRVADVALVDTITADLFAVLAHDEPVLGQVEPPVSVSLPERVAANEVTQLVRQPMASADEIPDADAGRLEEVSDELTGDADRGGYDESPAQPRRRRKRRRGRAEPSGSEGQEEALALDTAALLQDLDLNLPQVDLSGLPGEDEVRSELAPAVQAEALTEGRSVQPFTVLGLGLETPPALSAQALDVLQGAERILGTAEALDRLAGLGLEATQILCAANDTHLALHDNGYLGSVLVVVGDGAADGPGAELLAQLGPGNVRLLPGVGRVSAACASLGLSGELVSLVDLRRSPLAALRGQLRAHRLFAVPLADSPTPQGVARLLVDSGFAQARVWVCEFPAGTVRSRAWLATELLDAHEAFDIRAVLIIATGPSAGVFPELPGLNDAALGEGALAALPLAVRTLALAWLQPSAWETGWAIAEGEASLALEWARAVPTARLHAFGIEPSILGVMMASAGVGENLSAIPAASPLRCREWPMPEAVFIRGGAGLTDWLAAAWARLAPGGRLVATAEDDQARADLLTFAGQVPAEAWQELSLSRGETVAGRLRFAPTAPVRLALWRKPLAGEA